MNHSYFVCLCIWITLLSIVPAAGTVWNKRHRSQMTYRECLEKCVSKNYHGTIPSPVCSFGRSATFKQTSDGPTVRVNPSAAVPIYGHMAGNEENFPAGDVMRSPKTLSRVIRGVIREKRKDSGTISSEAYVTICRTCIGVTCFPSLIYG